MSDDDKPIEATVQPPRLEEFIITFGVQYAQEPHPTFEAAHPDGFVVIFAPDEETARAIAFGAFGRSWAFCYSNWDFYDKGIDNVVRLYPRGIVGTITSDIALKARPE